MVKASLPESQLPRILFNSTYTASQIFISETPSSRKKDSALEKQCLIKWQQIQKEARDKKELIWDSELYRLESVAEKYKKLYFEFSTVPFSTRIAMNSFSEQIIKLGEKFASFGVYASCFIRTDDDHLLFIEKSGKYHTTRKYSFVGGVLSKTEGKLLRGSDLFSQILTELKEETGIDQSLVESVYLRTGYVTENINFCLLFDIRLKISHKKVDKIFKLDTVDGEAARIIAVKPDKLGEFIEMMPDNNAFKFELMKSWGDV